MYCFILKQRLSNLVFGPFVRFVDKIEYSFILNSCIYFTFLCIRELFQLKVMGLFDSLLYYLWHMLSAELLV